MRKSHLDEDLVRSVTNSAHNVNHHPRRDDRINRSMPMTHRPTASVVLNQASDLHLDRVVLYKRGHYLDDGNYFVIEISVT